MTRFKIFFLMLMLFFTSMACANEMPHIFIEGIKAYKNGEFNKAISAFGKIADSGVKNGKLYYNLGNANLKNNDLGQAILWYERALKYMPNDPDLLFNYKYSISLTKDERVVSAFPFLKIVFFWKYFFNPKTVQWAALGFNLLFWTAVMFQMLRKKAVLKTLNYSLLCLTMLFTLTAFYNYYEAANLKRGIVLPEKISVRSGLGDGATELFVLHAGTKVKIQKQKADFVQIFFSEGKIGWVKKDAVGMI